jgi:hypothetical protein
VTPLFRQVSFAEIRDSLDPSTASPRAAAALRNVYPVDATMGAAVVGRPGFTQAGGQLGSGGTRRVQALYQFTKLDGTEFTVAICGGLMYTYDWATTVWTNVPLVGVALPTGGQVFCTTFANQLVVNPNDGINKPWVWDGTTFTSLTNAPLAFGAPTVYYGKLFFIKWTERTTDAWSEENQPNTGYEAGGFNNAWTMGQTDQEALYALMGTNEALYYWRARSAGAVYGAVTPQFSSTGTHEAVSPTIGTVSPGAVVATDGGAIAFLSADGEPHLLTPGGGLVPAWAGIRETLATIPRSQLPQALGVSDPLTRLELLGVPGESQSEVTQLLAVQVKTQAVVGVWEGFTPTALALVKDGARVPTLLHGTANGYVYQHGTPTGARWSDGHHTADGGVQPIAHRVEGTVLGWTPEAQEWAYVRADLLLRLDGSLTNAEFRYTTPNGVSNALVFTAAAPAATWDGAWDCSAWLGAAREQHVSLGLNGRGRWVQPQLTHAYADERFGLESWSVDAVPEGRAPGAR